MRTRREKEAAWCGFDRGEEEDDPGLGKRRWSKAAGPRAKKEKGKGQGSWAGGRETRWAGAKRKKGAGPKEEWAEPRKKRRPKRKRGPKFKKERFKPEFEFQGS